MKIGDIPDFSITSNVPLGVKVVRPLLIIQFKACSTVHLLSARSCVKSVYI